MRKPRPVTERSAFDLLEETVALLRRCPAVVLAFYYVGALPFVLGFLYFWADMSRGAFAREHLIESSFLIALGFLWCKFWQALFATHLLAVACQRPLPAWTWRAWWRMATAQATIQPSGLFVLPVAALVTVPLGLAYAFYHNASVLALNATGEALDGPALRRDALALARRWPMQNHVGLAVLLLFGLIVFVNVLVLILVLPWLLKSLLGIETMFTRSTWSMFNTTLFAAAGGISYLCVDPFCKAFYVLRCFYGQALATGEDIRVELRTSVGSRARVLAAIVLLCSGMIAAGAPPPGPAEAAARAAKIDRSVSAVLGRPEFAWRVPREAARPEDEGALGSFFDSAFKMMTRWLKPVKRAAAAFVEWLIKQIGPRDHAPISTGWGGWTSSLRFFAWIFCAVALVVLAVLGWKFWRHRTKPLEVAATPQQVLPDLAAAEVGADELPEDAWLGLAREMMARGDFRLALRALYLAVLAHLGERQIISIARSKSNLEYQREVRRRRPAQADLIAVFAETVHSFERAWYGKHEVSAELLGAAQTNLEKIRQC